MKATMLRHGPKHSRSRRSAWRSIRIYSSQKDVHREHLRIHARPWNYLRTRSAPILMLTRSYAGSISPSLCAGNHSENHELGEAVYETICVLKYLLTFPDMISQI